jgi:hypothetical protein
LDSDLDSTQLKKINELLPKISGSQIQNLMKLFLVSEAEIKLYPLPQIPLVLAACKYCLEDVEAVETSGTDSSNPDDNEEENEVTELKVEVEELEKTLDVPKKNIKGKKGPKFDAILKNWSEFLTKVRPVNTHVAAILRATNPTGVKDDTLIIEVFYRFHKEKLEEPKITSMLESVLSQLVASPIKLKFVLPDKKARVPKVVSQSDVIDVNLEKITAEISEIFSK